MQIIDKVRQTLEVWHLKPLDLLIILFFVMVTAKIASLYYEVDSEQEWDKYKAEHHCKQKLGNKGYERSTWICDDGQVHYQWRQQR